MSKDFLSKDFLSEDFLSEDFLSEDFLSEEKSGIRYASGSGGSRTAGGAVGPANDVINGETCVVMSATTLIKFCGVVLETVHFYYCSCCYYFTCFAFYFNYCSTLEFTGSGHSVLLTRGSNTLLAILLSLIFVAQLYSDHLLKLLQPSARTIPQKNKNDQLGIFLTSSASRGVRGERVKNTIVKKEFLPVSARRERG